MPNAKTVARVALAAVALPGVAISVAAPAASAAELTPAAKVADAQHRNLASAQHDGLSGVQHVTAPVQSKLSSNDIHMDLPTH